MSVAERGLIGCVLIEPVMCWHYAGQAGVKVDWFTESDCRNAWLIMSNMNLEYINAISVADEAAKRGVEISLITLSSYVGDAPIASYIHSWIKELRKEYLRRLIRDKAFLMSARADDPDSDPDELIATIQADLQDASFKAAPEKNIAAVYDGIIEQWNNAKSVKGIGIPSVWHGLQKMLGGYRNGKVYIIAARPGAGKSTYMMNEAAAIVARGVNTSIASVEMGESELRGRVLATACMMSAFALDTGMYNDVDLGVLQQEAKGHIEFPLRINDDPSMTAEKLAAWAQFEVVKHGAKIIAIDYLQLLSSSRRKSESRNIEIGKIMSVICGVAKTTNVPVLLLSQLSRNSSRENRPPELHDLRDSGSIEQDAYGVIFIHHKKDEADGNKIIQSEFIIAKHRGGPEGVVPIRFERNRQRFVEI